MSRPFFITSTGTGIGKTLVTTALCWQLREQKKTVTALKPVVSGFDQADSKNDSALILQSCGLTPTPQMMKAISPWQFSAPLAANVAAAREGKTIDFGEVAHFCRDHTALETDVVLVEGAGGVMAPLNDTRTMLDLMQELHWPVVLVAGSYLGSISHTLSALEVLRARLILVRALVISESEDAAMPIEEMAAAISGFVPAEIPVVKLPRMRVEKDQWKYVPTISWMCD